MNQSNITVNTLALWVVLVLGLFLAVIVGAEVGAAEFSWGTALIFLVPLLVLCVKLQARAWVLLPLGWHLSGRLPWLPLPFTVRELCFAAVIGVFLVLFAVRVVPWKRNSGLLDKLVLINLGYLVITYFRHPVGAYFLQSSMVGGRPYLEVLLATGAYFVLSRVQVSKVQAQLFPLFFVIPALGVAFLDLLVRTLPVLGQPINYLYAGISSAQTGTSLAPAGQGMGRFIGLKDLALSGSLALVSFFKPITLISVMYPLRVVLFALILIVVFLTGYRSIFVSVVAFIIISSVMRRRLRDLAVFGVVGILGLSGVVALQTGGVNVPLQMQRTLSWIPLDWDSQAVESAEGSSEWRFDMWRWAWNDASIMRDKVFGQGFGFTYDEMNIISAATMRGTPQAAFVGLSDRESYMITGALHSGPLSTIKSIGVVGLCLFFSLLIGMAAFAWRLCRKSYGTHAFTLALFVGIPVIYEPLHFIFIFGDLTLLYPTTLFYAGLLNLASSYSKTPSGMLPVNTT